MTKAKTTTPVTPPPPKFNDIVAIQREGWEGVPDGPNPYWLAASDGIFAHRRMLIGRGVARADKMPPFPKFGDSKGGFWFDADPIPGHIMSQIVDFFERIYDRQHTEAAVLLIMHKETKEWRVFVPTQLVSHGGVNYVFDPMHVRDPWIIVGSIHSHCDFGAGHSSTDTGDAADFDGLHCTIGMIKRDIPQIVAMVAMNKQLFHYKEESFAHLFDFSEPKKYGAPAWWDRYVEDPINKVKPVGFELYAKFQKATVVKSETKITKISDGPKRFPPSPGYANKGFVSTDYTWNEKAGRMVHKNWEVLADGSIKYPSGVIVPKMVDKKPAMDNIPGIGVTPILHESRVFNARKAAERGLSWDAEGRLEFGRVTSEDLMALKAIEEDERERDKDMPKDTMFDDEYWEDNADKALVDLVFDSELISEDDLQWAALHPDEATTGLGWARVFSKKLVRVVHVMRQLGFADMKIDFGTPKGSTQMMLSSDNDSANDADMSAGVH